jgi:hypothetical protein
VFVLVALVALVAFSAPVALVLSMGTRSLPREEPAPLLAPNTIAAGVGTLLLVTMPSGRVLHLAASSDMAITRWAVGLLTPPVDPWSIQAFQSELTAATWAPRTMCGLRWREMADAGAELDALLASAEEHWSWGGHICPVCLSEAESPAP